MNIDDLKSISPDQIQSFLDNYIKGLPDYAPKWKNFYEGGAGQTVITVGSGMVAMLAFAAYMNRKNSVLDYGTADTSVIAIATSLGYVYNRQSTPRLQITFNSSEDILWDRFTPIGTYGQQDLSLLADTLITKGENTIIVALGSWQTSKFTITDTTDFFGLMVEAPIDNQFYDLTLNNQVLPSVLYPEDMNETNVLVRSYKNGFYVIFGNGELGISVKTGDILAVNYISPADIITANTIPNTAVSLDIDNSGISSVEIADYGSLPDNTNKLVALAPGYRFARRLLMSINDYKYIGGAYPGNASVNARPTPGTCCTMNVAYCRNDQNLLTDIQKTEFKNYLNRFALLGQEFNIVDPQRIDVNISLVAVITDVTLQSAILESISNTYKKMCLTLGNVFSIGIITESNIIGLVRVYFKYPIKDMQANYNQYFNLASLNVVFTTDTTAILSGGTDDSLGYIINGNESNN